MNDGRPNDGTERRTHERRRRPKDEHPITRGRPRLARGIVHCTNGVSAVHEHHDSGHGDRAREHDDVGKHPTCALGLPELV
jgi:hypothetical protein